tara:strand:+ start:19 stop:324 length:306 start_codon:yes stop_codon:yes gene_type:complete
MKSKRLYYWGTFVPLVALLLCTYTEYKNQEALVEDGHKIHNRQLQTISMFHVKKLEEQKMRHMANTYHQNRDHQREIGSLVLFYSDVIKGIRDKNGQHGNN